MDVTSFVEVDPVVYSQVHSDNDLLVGEQELEPHEVHASVIEGAVTQEAEIGDGIIEVVSASAPIQMRKLQPTDFEVIDVAPPNKTGHAFSILNPEGQSSDEEEDAGEFVMNQTKDLSQSVSYWDSFDKAEAFLREHEQKFVVKYVSDRSQLGFTAQFDEEQWRRPLKGKSHIQIKNHIPCRMMGARVYSCRFGPEKKPQHKEMKRGKKASYKLGCTAKASMIRYAMYPEFRIKNPSKFSKYYRGKYITELKRRMNLGEFIEVKEMYELIISDVSIHEQFHEIGQNAVQHLGIDKRLRQRIHQLVELGVTSSPDMKRHLKLYVDDLIANTSLEPPSSNDPRFYPKDKTIANHIHLAKMNVASKNPGIEHSITLRQVQQANAMQQAQLEQGGTVEYSDTTAMCTTLGQLIEISTTCDREYMKDLRQLSNKNKRLLQKIGDQLAWVTDKEVHEQISQSLQDILKYAQQYKGENASARITTASTVEVTDGLKLAAPDQPNPTVELI